MSKITKEQVKSIVDAYGIKTTEDVQFAVKDLMKDVIQKTLDAELAESLGHEKYGRNEESTGNYRNGSYAKKVRSTFGEMDLEIPRDREGLHEPVIVEKGKTDVSDLESRLISMYARGMTTRDIQGHMHDIYGVKMSAEMISKITDKILPHIKEWQARILNSIYPILYMDAIHFNVRDNGRTIKKAVYLAMAVDCEGMRDVLGIWIGGNESSKYWLSVLTELKNRGVQDIFIACVDGLSGFDEAIQAVFPKAEIQRCIVHQIRYCCKFVNYKDRKSFCADMKSIYGAPSEESALEHLAHFDDKWGKKYAYAVRSWENNWAHLSTFFKYPNEIRRLIYTTNAIESVNSSIRKYTGQKRIFPTDDSTLKSVFLAVDNRLKKWTTRTRNWGLIFNQLSIHFKERLEVSVNS